MLILTLLVKILNPYFWFRLVYYLNSKSYKLFVVLIPNRYFLSLQRKITTFEIDFLLSKYQTNLFTTKKKTKKKELKSVGKRVIEHSSLTQKVIHDWINDIRVSKGKRRKKIVIMIIQICKITIFLINLTCLLIFLSLDKKLYTYYENIIYTVSILSRF